MGRGSTQGGQGNSAYGQPQQPPPESTGGPTPGSGVGLPSTAPTPFQPGPQATMPGPMGQIGSQPWGDVDWMQLREQFQGGMGNTGHNRAPQARSQARQFSPSGGPSQQGFRPQGIDPITTAGSVAGTQQSPTATVETGVTPPSHIAGAPQAPAGPPHQEPAAPAPLPGNNPGGPNAQALIKALRAQR